MAMVTNMAMAMGANVTKRLDRPRAGGSRLARRLHKQGPARVALAAIVAIVGYYEVSFSLAQASGRDAERAFALAPYDGRTAARLAAMLSGPEASAADRPRSDRLAFTALQQDAVSVPAAAALGFNAQMRGDTVTARRAFTYAEALSRRDPLTQLWKIEDAVAHNDVNDALRHYDIALRVKPEMSGALFPVLAAASVEAPVQTRLVRLLQTNPPWRDGFIGFVAARGTDPLAAAMLFRRLDGAGVTTPEVAKTALLASLFASGKVDQAWTYYRTMHPTASRDRSRSVNFSGQSDTPTPFDWVAVGDGGITGTIEKGGFDFSAPASIGGPMLQQVQLLSPGTYRLQGRSIDINQPDNTLPYWTLVCQNGRELGRVIVSRSSQGSTGFTGAFQVPAGCPVQTLVLVARPSDSISGLSGRIEQVELKPLSPGGRK